MTKKTILKKRKDAHIDLCLKEEVDYHATQSNGFSSIQLEHDALPELDYDAIPIETELFDKKLQAPFMIGAMTGGTQRASTLNRRLAEAAEETGIALALGSQRTLLEDESQLSSYAMKKIAPRLPLLLGNIGAVQLNYGVQLTDLLKLIELTECDAFNFHLNPLQEALQPEGNRNFSHLLSQLQSIIPKLKVPVVIKEVGAGISKKTALKLKDLPLAGIETAGRGGTSWAKIESLRNQNSLCDQELFSQWGVSTVESILACRETLPHLKLIASGGIRNGLEAAKAIALGADLVAFAMPFLKAAEQSTQAVINQIEQFKKELKIVLLITGTGSLKALRAKGVMGLEAKSESRR